MPDSMRCSLDDVRLNKKHDLMQNLRQSSVYLHFCTSNA